MTMITTFVTALSLLLGHPAPGGPEAGCDAGAIEALQARLPSMSNMDAQSFASERLTSAQKALDSGDITACSEALDHARKDMGVAGDGGPADASVPPMAAPSIKS